MIIVVVKCEVLKHQTNKKYKITFVSKVKCMDSFSELFLEYLLEEPQVDMWVESLHFPLMEGGERWSYVSWFEKKKGEFRAHCFVGRNMSLSYT